MSNFSFLSKKREYKLFSDAAIEAENVYSTSPAMCAIGVRKALELTVKWVYSADKEIDMPYRGNLQALIHERSFIQAMNIETWKKLPYIIKLGNLAVHTGKNITHSDVILSLKNYFEFVQWIDYCYGVDYEERKFDEKLIPAEKIKIDETKIKEQEALIYQKDSLIEQLRKQIEEMSDVFTKEKESTKEDRQFMPFDITEFETRKKYIDIDLKELGWILEGNGADVWEEYEVEGMAGNIGQKGYVDYVLFGKDKLPLAVIEAKRTSKDPNIGRKQAVLYADCLEIEYGQRPIIFTTNGFDTFFWDDKTGPQRRVSGLFSKGDLTKLMNRRISRLDLNEIKIDDNITDRYYQKEAIRAVCDNISKGFRKNLLVMATGTGKTRTASSLTDVLSRGGYVTNILFLADRTALVKQAKDDFKNYLPDMSLCNLCSNKDDKNARIVFSTYPTMLNSIDDTKNKDGQKLFTPAHFDLIIVDESHRSIFKKYRAIFEYFDAYLVGLTATPKTDVDRNTYEFFEMENKVPTYAYDYDTAVKEDHVLVPYYNYEVDTKFIDDGITYDDLSDEDKAKYEEDFIEDGYLPDFISSSELNKFIFNQDTVDKVIQDLMENGIKINGGDRLGKTIIFAQNKKHAEYILERFNALYPNLNGTFAQRVICDDTYAQTIIDDFKIPDKMPFIAVSVDMMDTGIDVPECVNLVFFKKVRSKTKFWQMIGRGTRLSPELNCRDNIKGEYTGKKHFLIFDYCGNFKFFRENKEGYESREIKTLSEEIFIKRIKIAADLQAADFADEKYQNWRKELVTICHEQITSLNTELISVKLKRKYVEKYRNKAEFEDITESKKSELEKELADLVKTNDTDEYAKRFDNLIYGLIISSIEGLPGFKRRQNQLMNIGTSLEKKAGTIVKIKQKLPYIKRLNDDSFWVNGDVLEFERIRTELRGLIVLIADNGEKSIIYTNLEDPVICVREGQPLEAAYDFEDYKKKVNRYVLEHGDTLAIHKLTNNIPLTAMDYKELDRVFTEELGSKSDYEREFHDTPFGLLIRKIAKLNHEAVMEAFSKFINDESLNQTQIAFVKKIIVYIEQNGYMENPADLRKAPFDKPISFTKLFNQRMQMELISTIKEIKENALKVV